MHPTFELMIVEPAKFLTSSLSKISISQQVCRILAAAINSVEPYTIVSKYVTRTGNTLIIGQQVLNLDAFRHVYVIGVGKAGVPMGIAVCEQLSAYFTQGIILTKDGYNNIPPGYISPNHLQIIEASHPLPDSRGVAGTRQIVDLLSKTDESDLVIFLISGGGSALLTLPASNLSIYEIEKATSLLLACGASIHEVNCIRKHLDSVKGGRLATIAAPSRTISLILSDVIGDHLDAIASGPTVPDPSTYQNAIAILEQYHLMDSMPAVVISHLKQGVSGMFPDTPKFGDPVFEFMDNLVIGNNRKASEAALHQALQEGFHSLILTNYLRGEANQIAKAVAAIAQQLAVLGEPVPRPACILLGGETTVTLSGNGMGGRNQELALSCVEELAGLDRVILITLATDGGDGPTDAAGAVVTGETYATAHKLGLQTAQFLTNNDAYNFFNPLADLIKTGPTQTNVNDLIFIFTY